MGEVGGNERVAGGVGGDGRHIGTSHGVEDPERGADTHRKRKEGGREGKQSYLSSLSCAK